jgi:hypothetical protein
VWAAVSVLAGLVCLASSTPAAREAARDDAFEASPALVDGDLLLRGHRFLSCISEG